MRNPSLFQMPKSIEDHFSPDAHVVPSLGDVNDFLKTIPDNSVRLIITSPPYNLGKDYESSVGIEKYLEPHLTQGVIASVVCEAISMPHEGDCFASLAMTA